MATDFQLYPPHIVDAGPYPGVYSGSMGHLATVGYLYGKEKGTAPQPVLYSSWVPGERYFLSSFNEAAEAVWGVSPVRSGWSEGGDDERIARISPSESEPFDRSDLRWEL